MAAQGTLFLEHAGKYALGAAGGLYCVCGSRTHLEVSAHLVVQRHVSGSNFYSTELHVGSNCGLWLSAELESYSKVQEPIAEQGTFLRGSCFLPGEVLVADRSPATCVNAHTLCPLLSTPLARSPRLRYDFGERIPLALPAALLCPP